MTMTVAPITRGEAEAIASWRYNPPYDIYNLDRGAIPVLLDPGNRYYSIGDDTSRLIGYCCFGAEARVPGGDYVLREPEVLDVGVGLAPKWVGHGMGTAFVGAILEFARASFSPQKFRVSVASFNQRSQRTFKKLGFIERLQFARQSDGMQFVQLERDATE